MRVLVALILAAVLAAGCTSSPPGLEPTEDAARDPRAVTQAPPGDAFYRPPSTLPAENGGLIWASPLSSPVPGTRGWRLLYRSESLSGDPIAVSAVMIAPEGASDVDSDRPILAVAHGTTGLADACAPSRAVADGRDGGLGIGLLQEASHERFVIVATDYEGLGTPGVHPYAVGLSSARSVLDSIRAAQRFPGTGASRRSFSVVWGHSQGGGAALIAAELAPVYAPDANVVGAAAGAPLAELKLLGTALRNSPYFGYVFLAAAGFKAAYPRLDLSKVLTELGLDAAERAGQVCAAEAIAPFAGKDPNLYLKADPGITPPLDQLLEENSPGVRSTDVPVFLYHGESDPLVPAVASKLVLDRYCANGTTAYRKTWPGADHSSVVALAAADVQGYLDDRLERLPPPTSC